MSNTFAAVGGSGFRYIYWYEVHRLAGPTVPATTTCNNGFNAGWVPCMGAAAILCGAAVAVETGATTNVNFNNTNSIMSMDKNSTGAISTANANGYSYATGSLNELLDFSLAAPVRTGLFATVNGSPILTPLNQAAVEAGRLVSLRCPSPIVTADVWGSQVSGTGITTTNAIARDLSTGVVTMGANATADAPAGVTVTFTEHLGGANMQLLHCVSVSAANNAVINRYIQHRFYRAALTITGGTNVTNLRVCLGVCYDTQPAPWQLALAAADPLGNTTGPVIYGPDSGRLGSASA